MANKQPVRPLPEARCAFVSSSGPMHVFGALPSDAANAIAQMIVGHDGLEVERAAPARSSKPHPQSTDLERSLIAWATSVGFEHHVSFSHPRTGDRFEFDFWRATGGIALEVMGYRADDEIYKDVLKFHVHDSTRVGVVLVPRFKWISTRRTHTNFAATLKALAFADSFMDVSALVAIAYDWREGPTPQRWRLTFPGE